MKLTSIDSAITTETVALSGKSFTELRSVNDRLFVNCLDPANKGKSCVLELVGVQQEGIKSGSVNTKAVTPRDANVRSAVHEYGGGSFLPLVLLGDGEVKILYTDYSSQHRLFVSTALDDSTTTEPPVPISTPPATRFADFFHDKKRCRILCVMEDHSDPRPEAVRNCIVSISLLDLYPEDYTHPNSSNRNMLVVAKGNDFYSTPTLSPNGLYVAYTTWNHPNMPWYTTTIGIQKLDEVTGEPIEGHLLTVPSTSPSSVVEPRWWTNDTLVYLSDESDWYNLYAWDIPTTPDNENSNPPICLWKKDSEFCEPHNGWVLGLSPYIILPDGRIVAKYVSEGGSILVLIQRKSQQEVTVQEIHSSDYLPSAHYFLTSLCCCGDGSAAASTTTTTSSNVSIYCFGGSPTDPFAIWKLPILEGDGAAVKIASSVDSKVLNLDTLQEFCSIPKKVAFPNKRDSLSYAYLYLPNHLSISQEDSSSWKPPLLVKVHGGPTASASSVFRLNIQYWTSRGFAVLDVDYGGSTGYGRNYRLSLNRQWGIIDIDDVCSGAEWCVMQGLVDANAICIDGGSAGGYTTLASLTFRDTFRVGASLYGVSDLSALAKETHKFESRYLDTLIGDPFPSPIYEERSPIHFTDRLNCPVILLQGDEDAVVPPNQAEKMYNALQEKNIPTTLVLYKGEQHGFRMSYNIRHALHSEYTFFCKILGYEAQREDGLEDITIGERLEV